MMRLIVVLVLSALAVANPASAQESAHKDVVNRYFAEMWNQNKPELIEDIVSSEYRHKSSSGAEWRGTDHMKELVRSVHEALSNLHYTIESAMAAEGDLVATRTTVTGTFVKPLLGIPPTNIQVSYQEWIWHRIRDGKIVEGWTLTNADTMLRRSSTVPAK